MNNHGPPQGDATASERKHPAVHSIEDLTVFKVARLVAIAERFGMRWSEQLFGISVNEWRLLGLTQAHAPARAGDLAELMLMDKSQLSRVIKSLTTKKLITSRPDPKDARAVVLNVTTRGQVMVQQAISQVLQRNEQVIAPLSTEEAAQFHGLLDRLIAHNLTILDRLPKA